MWCSRCQQDVPGIARQQRICCARCGEQLSSGYASTTAGDATAPQTDEPQTAPRARSPKVALDSNPPVNLDNWQLEDDLRTAARLVQSLRGSGRLPRATDDDTTAPAFDTGHASLPPWHAPPSSTPAPPAERLQRRPPRRRKSSFFSWAMLSLGLMTFVCGGVLLGWSLFTERAELWNLGMPLVLVGQAALIAGLVFQLDGLWQSNRETSRTLDELDHQLDDLKHATTLLGSSHSCGARSFYAHLAEGASPQLLLTDLKGQMDLLALRLAQQRR